MMGEKVKALLWEECRVGGAIAGLSLVFGVLTIMGFRLVMDASAAHRDPEWYLFLVLLAPALVALLLILNPDHLGILRGGYAQRVLRLPVPTALAVGISLCSRTVFVALVTLISLSVAAWIFSEPPEFRAILLIGIIYLAVQLIDWLRQPISGLSSAVLAMIGLCLLSVFPRWDSSLREVAEIWAGFGDRSLPDILMYLLFALLATLAVAIPAVSATRVGRRWGIPEVWEWPGRIALRGAMRRTPFISPVSAQVWYDLRRTGWILPATTLMGCGLAFALPWMVDFQKLDSSEFQDFVRFCPFMGVLLGAVAQGTRSGIGEIRRRSGAAGYAYLRPLTSSHFAHARVLANLVSLLPALAVATTLHFWIINGSFFTFVYREALIRDVGSMREVVWGLTGRGLLFGLLAWALLSLANRFVIGSVFGACTIYVISRIAFDIFNDSFRSSYALVPVALFLIGCVAMSLFRVWRLRLISTRAVLLWTALWLLAAWTLHGASQSAVDDLSPNFLWVLLGHLVCIGLAALVPLPYLAALFDIRRHRHGVAQEQDPAQHAQAPLLFGRGWHRCIMSGVALLVVVGAVWLGWPARPAFEAAFRQAGLPATLEELDAWYPAVPPGENRALQYLEIAKTQDQLHNELRVWVQQNAPAVTMRSEDEEEYCRLLVTGDLLNGTGEAIPETTRAALTTYWERVTSHVAPALVALSESGRGRSRYPIDLKDAYLTGFSHLSALQGLVRELMVDELYWSMAAVPERAVASILAIFAIADSLSDEPDLISQMTRNALIELACSAVENHLSRHESGGEELLRLQQAFGDPMLPATIDTSLQRAAVAESLIALTTIRPIPDGSSDASYHDVPAVPLLELIAQTSRQRIIMALVLDALRLGQTPESRFWADSTRLLPPDIALQLTVFQPSIASISNNGRGTKTQLDLAMVAAAVERYRLAEGALPNELEALTPVYLDAVPPDRFAQHGAKLRYAPGDSGKFTVYSVGLNGKDDSGKPGNRKSNYEGDLTFTVQAPVKRPA
ncbi:MAG: hypothetical protein HYV27_03685 [Candidatus Hydrogenedentes bacterium]|nr:hypothetical protein [Candidatus Hydrogenedentota bacterium]